MPIIKSKGRKDTGFKQLVDYLCEQEGNEVETFTYLHNIFVDSPDDKEEIVKAFFDNDTYRKERENGNAMYHEIMAFHPDDRQAIINTPGLLEDFAGTYIDHRAPDALVMVKPHIDKGHIHLHFMISANEYKSEKGVRISKKRYFEIQKIVEDLQVSKYPQLTYSYASGNSKRKSLEGSLGYSDKEWKIKTRISRETQKRRIAGLVQQALARSYSAQGLHKLLKPHKLKVYMRSRKLYGVQEENTTKKYRFTTLLGKEHKELQKVARWNEQKISLKKIVQTRRQQLDLDLDLGLEIE